jgi:hypothetical protein
MSATAERKYALTKVGLQDYVLPSNDAKTLWRIATYGEDDGIVYWGIWRWSGRLPTSVLDFHWECWDMVDGRYETRRDAIREAMRLGPNA